MEFVSTRSGSSQKITFLFMKKQILIFSILCLNALQLFAQRIDSLPFQLDKGLLVINGKVNNIETEWVFDTGAGISITTETFNKQAGLNPIQKKKKVRDANKNIQKIKQVIIPHLSIGNFTSEQLKVASFDMPFLTCQNLQLLGQDFMKALNWKIDFESNMIYISDSPFIQDSNMVTWDIFYEGNRPFTQIQWGNQPQKCLIDFGYRGYLDLNENIPVAIEALQEKKKEGAFLLYRSNSMGLLSTVAKDIHYIMADSLSISNQPIYNLPVSISNYSSAKIGLHFFTTFSRTLIINNNGSKFFYTPKLNPTYALPPLDAGFTYDKGKLLVSEKNKSNNSSSALLSVGEEIKSINGKVAEDFGSYCALFSWRISYTSPTLLVEKMDGTKVEIQRQSITTLTKNN